MPEVTINITAVLVAAVASMVVGFLWYSPALFGKEWMNLVGVKMSDMKKDEMPKLYGTAFIIAIVTAYVLAHIVFFSGANTALLGAQAGFWSWLGFSFTTMVSGFLWLKKPMKLLMIDAGQMLVGYVIMGVILASWV